MYSVLDAVTVYFFLWALIRLTGRRAIGQLTTFEFVLFLIIGGAVQRALTGRDYSLTNAFLIVATLVLLDVVMSLIERESGLFGKFLRGVPMVVVENGRPLLRRMHWARVSESQVLEAARLRHGIEDMREIKFAILETSGEISVIPERQSARRAARKIKNDTK